jgi:peroxiredoxin
MKRVFPVPCLPAVAALLLASSGCKSEPVVLMSFQDEEPLKFPDSFPNDKPIILAFLNANDRTCDQHIRPLRAYSSTRPQVTIVGVLAYDDNSFLQQITTQREMTFTVLLDPKKRLVDRYGVSKYPTYLFLSPEGKVIDRQYDAAKLKPWYRQIMIDKALGRRHQESLEDFVDE